MGGAEARIDDPRELVETAFQRLNDHDLDGYYALCAEDFTSCVGRQSRGGVAEARTMDEPLFAALPDHWRRIDKLLVSGDTVVVWLTFGGTPTRTGRPVTLDLCNVIEVRDGLIRSVTMYADWRALAEALSS